MKVNLKRSELAAALCCASDDEIRYMLNGALLEVKPDAKPLLVSTDGRCMLLVESEEPQGQEAKILEQVVLKREFIKDVLAIMRSKKMDWVTVETFTVPKGLPAVRATITQSMDGVKFVCEAWPIEGNFPAYAGVFPVFTPEAKVTCFAFKWDTAEKLQKAFKAINSSHEGLLFQMQSETDSIAVTSAYCPNAYGILMPMRGAHYDAPKFISKLKPTPPKKT